VIRGVVDCWRDSLLLSAPAFEFALNFVNPCIFDAYTFPRFEMYGGGLDSAALISTGPRQAEFQLVGRAKQEPAQLADWQDVGSDYFKVMQIPLKQGRFLTQADVINKAPVAVIDERLAKDFFLDLDPVGKQIANEPPLTIRGCGGIH
jgi:hypothetical protein